MNEQTDIELFKSWLKDLGEKFEVIDWGGTSSVNVHFTIGAGIGGSHDTSAFAAFHRGTGKFQGIYHDD